MEGLNGRFSTAKAAAIFQSCPVSGALCHGAPHETSGANYDIIETGRKARSKSRSLGKISWKK